MTITDATTSTTTAWTEVPTVSFTAGTLATIAECVTEIESKLKRGTLSATTAPTSTQVQNWLIFAKEELAEIKNFTWRRRIAVVDTESGIKDYALPPDYNGGLTTLRDTTNKKFINIWPPERALLKYPHSASEPNDKPKIGVIRKLSLRLIPTPDAVYTLALDYDRTGDDNTATDFTWLPEIERYRCTHYACWQAFMSLHMWQEAGYYKQQWEQGLGKAIRADGRRKWKDMKYRAISMFQEYAARNYQS